MIFFKAYVIVKPSRYLSYIIPPNHSTSYLIINIIHMNMNGISWYHIRIEPGSEIIWLKESFQNDFCDVIKKTSK